MKRVKLMNKGRAIGVAAAFAGVAIAPAAHAADPVQTTLQVNAEVTANCVASTTAVQFGTVDVTAGGKDGTGGLTVTCTSGTAWTATADAGANAAALTDRRMINGANELVYSLYTSNARTTVWGDGVEGGSGTITGTGTGTADNQVIYASIPAGQTSLPAGVYADTVNVTVTY